MQKSVSQQPLSCIKEGWGQQTSNKFETSEQFHPIPAFQNGGTEFTTKYAPEGRLHVQTGPKRRLLLCSSKKESGKYVWFQWEGTLYEFLCLCFGLGPTPLISTKILKVPISLLRRLQIHVIIYLDDMLLMSQTLEELLMSRDTIIFFLIQLGFVINLKKSILVPVQQIEFLGLEMKLSLPQRKVKEIVQMSQNAMEGSLTLRDMTKLLGKLTSTIQAILPAKLQICFLQQVQIQALRKKK